MKGKSKLNGFVEGVKKQFDKFAAEYKRAQGDFHKKYKDIGRVLLYKSLDPFVKGKKLLDIGCGFGKDSAHFAEVGAQEVYGIDTSKKMIELARKDYPFLKNLSVQFHRF